MFLGSSSDSGGAPNEHLVPFASHAHARALTGNVRVPTLHSRAEIYYVCSPDALGPHTKHTGRRRAPQIEFERSPASRAKKRVRTREPSRRAARVTICQGRRRERTPAPRPRCVIYIRVRLGVCVWICCRFACAIRQWHDARSHVYVGVYVGVINRRRRERVYVLGENMCGIEYPGVRRRQCGYRDQQITCGNGFFSARTLARSHARPRESSSECYTVDAFDNTSRSSTERPHPITTHRTA